MRGGVDFDFDFTFDLVVLLVHCNFFYLLLHVSCGIYSIGFYRDGMDSFFRVPFFLCACLLCIPRVMSVSVIIIPFPQSFTSYQLSTLPVFLSFFFFFFIYKGLR